MADSDSRCRPKHEYLNKVAILMVGFGFLMPLRLVITCAFYAMQRFQLPLDNVGLFINQFNNPVEISYLIGFIISTAITMSTPKKKDWHRYLSISTNCSTVLCSIILLFSYTTGGEMGHVTYYYWILIIYPLVAGMNYTFCVAVDPANVTYNNLGLPLSGIFIFLYHWICMKIFNTFHLKNIEFWLVVYQIIIMISITIAASVLWTLARFYEITEESGQGSNEASSCTKAQDSAPPQQTNSGCCCCCKECKKDGEAECKCDEGDDGNCKMCKIAKILCCLCKKVDKCTECVEKFSKCVEQLTSGDCSSEDAESLKCTCEGCERENTCCRVKRFVKFCTKSCDIINTATCYCTTFFRICFSTNRINSGTVSTVRYTYRAIIELCACCSECGNDCLNNGKCGIVNILKCLFADGKCLCQNQASGSGCNSLCKCVLDLFKKIKCALNISPCVNCSPCTATETCQKGQCCLVCWKRLFKCYIICGVKCKQEEGKCKCCCVGGESCEEECTCCKAQSPPAKECTCAEGEKCCSCCISCGETCKKTCKCKDGGECDGKCCCCCKENCQSSKTQSSSTCIFVWIYYRIVIIIKNFFLSIQWYYEAFYCYCTSTSPHSSCKCCCCKDGKCACPGHTGQVQAEDCKCCCCEKDDHAESPGTGGQGDGKKGGPLGLDIPEVWSPIMMDFLSLGFLYVFFPSILPFQLVDPQSGYYIQLINLFTTTLPATIIILLDLFSVGPNRKWENKWILWHYTWVLMAPYILCMVICIITLHYPDSAIASVVQGNKYVVCVLTIIYTLSEELLEDIGLAGSANQGRDGKPNGVTLSFSAMGSVTIMTITMLIADGYLQVYRKSDRDHWPTRNYSSCESISFWICSGIKVAWKSNINAFTLDLRKTFLEKVSVTE